MALELTSLVFKTETSDLERASKVIGELVTNVGKLDKAARTAAQTEATLARAAKDSAKSNLDNAKAQDVRLKSTITADKADQQAAAAIERKTKATERASTAIKKNADMLQLQNDTYDFILEGFSKGDAKVLAMAKATGQLSDQLKQVLTDIRQFSKNTFDQTETGLDRMVKSAKEASSAQGFLNNGLNLTSKQAKELSNDLDRLNIRLQHQGKSYQEITKEQAIYKQRFVEEANAVNRATSALAAVEKQRKDVVSATNYLTQAEAKMAAALNTSNAAIDKAGTDSLVKYESALRKSGISQDVATAKLATYKAQLTQVAGLEEKRRAQHLTRALTPQISDVAVSLWSGQSPLTVLLQQGAQINDMFQLSGVAAADFGKTVKEAFSSMLPSIRTVVKGFGGLIVDGFMAAGNATRGFIADIFGVTGAMDKFYMKLSENGPSKFGGMILTASSILTGVFAVGIAVVVAGLVGLGIGLKQVIEENNELAKTLALSGGQLGLSHAAAIQYAKSMELTGVSTGESIKVISEMAKAGNLGKDSINMITRAAIDMEAYAGVPIEETVKAFSKFKDKPVEALVELAKQTGLVSEEVLKSVRTLQEQGDQLGAASLAMAVYAGVTRQQSARIKEDYNGLSLFFKELGKSIGDYWDGIFKNLFRLPSKTESLEASLGILKDKLTDARNTVALAGPVFATERQKQEVKDLESRIRAITSEIGASVRVEGERQRAVSNNIANAKADEQTAALRAKYATTEQQALAEITKLRKQEELWKKDGLLTDERRLIIESGIAAEQKKIDKAREHKPSPSENYYATLMREATNNTIAANTATQELTKSEQKLLEVKADPRFAKLTTTQQADVIAKYDAAIATEQQTALTEKLAEAEEHRLKLLGKSEGIGKQYYSDMQKLEEFAKVAGWSREEVEELTRAVFKSTPAWKAYEKALEDVKNAARKFNEDSLASQAATLKENESLDYRLSLLGKTTEEQRALSIEYNRANKISEVRIKLAKQLRDIEADIEKAKKAGLPEEKYKNLIDAQVQARKDAAEQEKVINREVAVQYAEDLQKEFDAIKNGISDSIVTALFEGGKAGSKKLRNLVVAELSKPVTMVVNAVVNTLVGNVVGSSVGGLAGGAGGSVLGSVGSSILGNAATGAAGSVFGGIGSGFMSGMSETLLGSSFVGPSASAAGGSMGFAAQLGAAAPYLLGAAALYSIISGMDDSGTYHTGGASRYSRGGGLTSGNSGAAFDIGFGQVETGKETISAMETLSKSLVEIFDGIAKTFGKTAGYEVAVAFADDTSEDGAWGAFAVRLQGVEILNWDDFRQSKWAPKEFGDGEEGYKQYLAAVAKDTRKILTDMDIPGWAKTILNDIGEDPSMEALSGAIQLLAQVETVFKSFGQYMPQFAILADSSKEALIKASGGVQALAGNMSSFVNAFYTDADKLEMNTKNVADAMAALGLPMVKTRAEFKALVESQMALGESGAANVAALLSLSTAMDAILPAFSEAENSVIGMSETLRSLKEEANSLEIEILRLQGKNPEADTRQRQLDTSGFSKAEIAAYDYNQSLREQIRVLQQLTELQQQSTNLEIELLRAKGQTAEADARQRAIDTAGMSEAEIVVYDYNQSIRDQIKVLTEASNLRAGLISLESRFTGGGFSKQYKAEDAAREVNSLLSSVGINKDVATITSALLNSTTDEVQGYFREIWEVLDTDEARLRLVQVSNAMLDVATTSETAAEKFQKQSDNLSKLATEVSSLFDARNSAGSLLDKIAGAMGSQGSFAAQREGELWNALGSTSDYKKQVELASQLTDIVLERQQLEIQNAERLLSFGQGLRDYVNGLKLSDLSPLTNAEKLAEASKQYSETLSKAIGGDANAQSGLQSISSSYLELARTYYAGNEQFSNIFNSVTSALDTLGINSMTESQQQIAIGNQSLEELQKLYGITETAYEALNTQYENSLSQLIAAQDALVLQASSLEQLVSISNLLTNLPTEIAVRMPVVNTELNPLNFSNAGATSDSSNAELLEELKLLRIQVAKLEASNREDARMQADVFVGASQANADSIASATTKAARAAELKQGAIIK